MGKIIRSTTSTTYKQGDHSTFSTVTIEREYTELRLKAMRCEIADEIAEAIKKGEEQRVKEFTLAVCDLNTYSVDIIVHTVIEGANNDH